MKRNSRILIIFSKIIVIVLFLGDIPFTFASDIPIEETISRRRSTHAGGTYTSRMVGEQLLLKVLWAAYGYTSANNRSVPSIGGGYPLIIYTVNASGSYRFVPEAFDLVIHNAAVTKKTITPYNQGWPSEADHVLVVVWNRTKMSNQYFASAEAGCLVQNVYLKVISLGLGTCCVGGVDSEGLRNALKLNQNLVPLLVMPLGYPVTEYSSSSPNYDVMNGNLPPIQKSNMSLDEAIFRRRSYTTWSNENITLWELSNLLWAAYGSSNTSHRTTPSAFGTYPLIIYILNKSGVYQYIPEKVKKSPPVYYHYIVKIVDGDYTEVIASITSNLWVSEAPYFFVFAYDSEFNHGNTGDGSAGPGLEHEFIEINVGCVIQNIFLESTALKLGANLLTEGLEDWNGIGATKIRNILDLRPSIIPLYIMPIGHLPVDKSPKRAVFEISRLEISPEEIKQGDVISISFKVTNIGNLSGSHFIDLKVDGLVAFSTILHLDVRESIFLSTSVQIETVGDHIIEIGGVKEVLSVVSRLNFFNSLRNYLVVASMIVVTLLYIYLNRRVNQQ